MTFSEEALYDIGQFHQEPEQKVEEISIETSDVIDVIAAFSCLQR